MSYTITQDCYADVYEKELETLMREHYSEMQKRLEAEGFKVSDYNPKISDYAQFNKDGWLLLYMLRWEGKAIGYSTIYLTESMHNHDFIAEEDTLFVTKLHRNGIGKKFVEFILSDLRSRGVKHLTVSAKTDLRVAKLWKRMGFKEVAVQMQYTF